MSARGKGWIVLLLGAGAVGSVFAEPASLDLEQVVARVQAHDARLVPYDHAHRLARLRTEKAVARENPELRLGTGLEGGDPDQDASIRFFPLHPWGAKALKQEYAALADEQDAALADARRKTALEAMALFYELQSADRELTLYSQIVEVHQAQVQRADQQLAGAVATEAEALLVQWDLFAALEKQHDARTRRDRAKALLAASMRCSVESFDVVPLDENVPVRLQTLQVYHAAVAASPELMIFRALRAGAEARLRATRATSIPWLNHVEIGWGNNDRGWELETAISLPLFTPGGIDRLAAGEEAVMRAAALTTMEQQLWRQVEAAVDGYNHAMTAWMDLHTAQSGLAKKTRAFLARIPASERRASDDFLVLERRLLEGELKSLALRCQLHAAAIELADVVGKPLLP